MAKGRAINSARVTPVLNCTWQSQTVAITATNMGATVVCLFMPLITRDLIPATISRKSIYINSNVPLSRRAQSIFCFCFLL